MRRRPGSTSPERNRPSNESQPDDDDSWKDRGSQ
jgi:hypothetical protein